MRLCGFRRHDCDIVIVNVWWITCDSVVINVSWKTCDSLVFVNMILIFNVSWTTCDCYFQYSMCNFRLCCLQCSMENLRFSGLCLTWFWYCGLQYLMWSLWLLDHVWWCFYFWTTWIYVKGFFYYYITTWLCLVVCLLLKNIFDYEILNILTHLFEWFIVFFITMLV